MKHPLLTVLLAAGVLVAAGTACAQLSSPMPGVKPTPKGAAPAPAGTAAPAIPAGAGPGVHSPDSPFPPLATRADAIAAVRKARLLYFGALMIALLFMVLALGELIEQLDFKAITVINLVFTFITNVWILTLITTDVLIAGLDRARGLSAGTAQLADDFDRQLATFIGQKTVAMAAVAPPPGVEVPP